MIYAVDNLLFQVKEQVLVRVDHLQLQQGKVLGIMGPNGAGKSTLLKLMALLEKPTLGSISFRGQQVYPGRLTLDLRRQMATVFQQPLLLDASVFHNVEIGLKLRKVSRKVRAERVQHWLETFRVAHLAKRHAHTLSGGEAQRVSLARAFVLEPSILLMDEPFSALDYPTKVDLLQDVKRILAETQVTTVFVSHDLHEVKYLTDDLLVIMDGEVQQQGPTLDIISRPNEKIAPFFHKWQEIF